MRKIARVGLVLIMSGLAAQRLEAQGESCPGGTRPYPLTIVARGLSVAVPGADLATPVSGPAETEALWLLLPRADARDFDRLQVPATLADELPLHRAGLRFRAHHLAPGAKRGDAWVFVPLVSGPDERASFELRVDAAAPSAASAKARAASAPPPKLRLTGFESVPSLRQVRDRSARPAKACSDCTAATLPELGPGERWPFIARMRFASGEAFSVRSEPSPAKEAVFVSFDNCVGTAKDKECRRSELSMPVPKEACLAFVATRLACGPVTLTVTGVNGGASQSLELLPDPSGLEVELFNLPAEELLDLPHAHDAVGLSHGVWSQALAAESEEPLLVRRTGNGDIHCPCQQLLPEAGAKRR